MFCCPREHDGLFHCAAFFGSCVGIAMGVVCSRPAHCCGADVWRISNLIETSRFKDDGREFCVAFQSKRNSSQQARILSDVASDRDSYYVVQRRSEDVCALSAGDALKNSFLVSSGHLIRSSTDQRPPPKENTAAKSELAWTNYVVIFQSCHHHVKSRGIRSIVSLCGGRRG